MRYLKITLLIGILTSLLIAGLYEAGAFRRIDAVLAAFFGRAVPRTYSDHVLQYVFLVFFSCGIAWTTIDIGRTSLKCIVAAAALLEVMAGSWIVDRFGGFFSPFVSISAILISFAASVAFAQSSLGTRKRTVHTMFGDRISPRTFNSLVNSDIPLRFEGEMREATVLVCEIFNHNELSESLTVSNYVAMNNAFLHNAAEFLVERGAYLDECNGESLRVVFGTPLPDMGHASTACEAALALASRLDEVNRECAQIWGQMFDYRIGINSGEIVVAAYGSRRLAGFSIAGEPVEFARRLCAANTIYGSRLLIGSQTFTMAEPDIEVRPIEMLQRHPDVPDREEIYELLALRHTLSDSELDRRDQFWKAIVYYREQRWDEALALLHRARTGGGTDGPVEFYIRRIEQLRAGVPVLDWHKPQPWPA